MFDNSECKISTSVTFSDFCVRRWVQRHFIFYCYWSVIFKISILFGSYNSLPLNLSSSLTYHITLPTVPNNTATWTLKWKHCLVFKIPWIVFNFKIYSFQCFFLHDSIVHMVKSSTTTMPNNNELIQNFLFLIFL